MANQYKNQAKMTFEEFEKLCVSKGDDWTVKELYKVKQELAKSREICKSQQDEIFENKRQKSAELQELDILRDKADKFNFLLRKVGYTPKKLLIYYKEEGCRDYALGGSFDCIHECEGCDYHYETDRIGTFILYDFIFQIGTTYDDFDGFEHSVLEGISVNLEDVCLSKVTKVVDLDTDKVLFEREGE